MRKFYQVELEEGATLMRTLTSWPGLNLFMGDMDRLFDRVFEPRAGAFEVIGDWAPKLDLSETEDAFFAVLEVPGVTPKGINVSIRGGTLVVTGEKPREKERAKERFHRIERAWGTFARMIPLSSPVEAEEARAVFTEGILTVTLCKTAIAKGGVVLVNVE